MPYRKTKNGEKRWVGSVMINGRRKEKIFDTKKDAKTWEAEMHSAGDLTATPSLLKWAEQYLDYSTRFSPKVYSEKRGAFRRFFHFTKPSAKADKMTPRLALEFLQKEFDKRTGNAVNRDRKNLVAAWNWGIRYLDMPKPNPFELVDKFPADEKGHYVPSEGDFRKVLGVAEGQDKIMLLTFLHTAGRRGEIYRLQWEDVDFINQRICLKTRKRKGGSLESDWIPMTEELTDTLRDHHKAAVNEWVFIQPKGQHKGKPYTENRGFPQALCDKAEVKRFGCHGIRGLTASILAKHDVPMVAIRDTLRHKNLRITERYVRGLDSVRGHLKVLEVKTA
nr:tyrosine-type recombinase/integrase [Pseudodesulfovibrio sp.]